MKNTNDCVEREAWEFENKIHVKKMKCTQSMKRTITTKQIQNNLDGNDQDSKTILNIGRRNSEIYINHVMSRLSFEKMKLYETIQN